MIPSVFVLGLLLGRWWWSVPLLAFAWAALMLAANSTLDPGLFFGAALFAAVNAAVGFLVHQVISALLSVSVHGVRAATRR